MHFVTKSPDDGPLVIELDTAGLGWLQRGLEQLESVEPDAELTCPSFVEDDDGAPKAATDFVLRRVPDPEEL